MSLYNIYSYSMYIYIFYVYVLNIVCIIYVVNLYWFPNSQRHICISSWCIPAVATGLCLLWDLHPGVSSSLLRLWPPCCEEQLGEVRYVPGCQCNCGPYTQSEAGQHWATRLAFDPTPRFSHMTSITPVLRSGRMWEPGGLACENEVDKILFPYTDVLFTGRSLACNSYIFWLVTPTWTYFPVIPTS